MTEHLYYTDSYRTEFAAKVIDVTQVNSRPALVLDQTCFYPTSGGQPHDTGFLDDFHVVDVLADDHVIFHVLDRSAGTILAGQAIRGKVDWSRRYDHMQQHSGQHLISQIFDRLYKFETVSVHFGATDSTLDLDTPDVTQEQLDQAEKMANELIFQAVPIKAYFVTDAEMKHVPVRRPPKVTGQIRIVEIDGFDYSACGGTHVHTTGESGPVKFVRQERRRGQTRITFLCGMRAVDDYGLKHRLIIAAANLYSNEVAQVPDLIARSLDQVKELQRRVVELQEGMLAYEAHDLTQNAAHTGDYVVIAQYFEDKNANAVKTLASLLTAQAHTIALLGSTQGGKATVVFARAEDVPLHAGNLLRSSLQQYGGGGGGRPEFAQGGGVAPDRMPDLIEFAIAQARAELGKVQSK